MIDKKKTLILCQTKPSIDPIFNKWIENGYNASVIFKEHPKLYVLVRRILAHSKVKFGTFLYENWINELDKYSTIIIHVSSLTYHVTNMIKEKYPDKRIIMWYWNTVNRDTNPELYRDIAEVWSFDKNDCEKYDMKYNTQYYQPQYDINKLQIEYDTDVFFIGHDNGRKSSILEFERKAEKLGVNCDIRISDTRNGWYIPYSEVEKRILNCKAILEFNQRGQVGTTLRALEALFYNKKLITDNYHIKDEPYYNSNNIFIIGYDKMDNLVDFINSKYDDSVIKIRSNYSLETWFNGF